VRWASKMKPRLWAEGEGQTEAPLLRVSAGLWILLLLHFQYVSGIPAELLKHGKIHWQRNLHSYSIPSGVKRRFLMNGDRESSWHYQKGGLSDCKNWRGITLLSVPGNLFCTVIINRMKSEIYCHLREEKQASEMADPATNRSLLFGIFLNSARVPEGPCN